MNRNFMNEDDYAEYVDYKTMDDEDDPQHEYFTAKLENEGEYWNEDEPEDESADKNTLSNDEKQETPRNFKELYLEILEKLLEAARHFPEWVMGTMAKASGVFLHAVMFGDDSRPINVYDRNKQGDKKKEPNADENKEDKSKNKEKNLCESQHQKEEPSPETKNGKTFTITEMMNNGIYQNAAKYMIQYKSFCSDALIHPFGLNKQEAESIFKQMQDDRIITIPNEKGAASPLMNAEQLKEYFKTGKQPENTQQNLQKDNFSDPQKMRKNAYEKAVKLVNERKECDIELLVTELEISLNEAWEIVDQMEKDGLITSLDEWEHFQKNEQTEKQEQTTDASSEKKKEEIPEEEAVLTEEELLNFCNAASDEIFHKDIEEEIDYSDYVETETEQMDLIQDEEEWELLF